jgi:hypothetical protein
VNQRLGFIGAIGVAIILLCALGFLLLSSRDAPQGSPGADSETRSSPRNEPAGTAPIQPAPPMPKNPDPILGMIEEMLAQLERTGVTPAELAAFRDRLLSLPAQQVEAAIRAFLESGRDAGTSQQFVVGPGGKLEGAPTLRTFLLDVLGQLGKRDRTPIAGALSREILKEKTSADEWSVALRNVGWAEPQAKSYLATKAREMLSHEPWISEPSDGFVEAFDVIAFAGDASLIPRLRDLLASDNQALQRASAVALDRLSEMAPLEVMTHLNANPNQFADLPFLRADFFAKADFTNPAQRAALETYLSRPDVTVPEKAKLLQALAVPASFVSDNLLTPPPRIDEDDGASRHQQLIALYSQWQTQNRFPELRQEIGKVQARLTSE